MPEQLTDIQNLIVDLSYEAFNVFLDDIATMFDVATSGKQISASMCKMADLKKEYRAKCGIWVVKADGMVDGNFFMAVKSEGIFTLAGTFVMQPEQIIAQNRNRGGTKEMAELDDAISEVGNLMVGSWDRAFREGGEGQHGHFVQDGTIIDDPWKNVLEKGLEKDEDLFAINYEMMVEPFDAFQCVVFYPLRTYTDQPAEEKIIENAEDAQADDIVEPAVSDARKQQPKAEEVAPEPKQAVPEAAPEVSEPEKVEAQSQEPVKEETASAEDTTTQHQQTPEEKPITQAINKLVNEATGAISSSSIGVLLVADIMTNEIVWATPEDTVETVYNLTRQHNCSHILIKDQEKLAGIVADYDLQAAMSPYLRPMFANWKRPEDLATLEIKIKWIMSRPVHTIGPDAPLSQAIKLLCDKKIGILPVVDTNGAVQGTISIFDILNKLV